MVDLYGQYLKIKDEIDTALGEVIESTAFIRGPQVTQFQDALGNYLGVPYVISCANGTDALQLAIMALDLKPGDEIISTPFTFISAIEVIKLLGMKPVLCDVNPDTFNIDPRQLEKLVTEKTRAILPVHLFGQCADMKAISRVASRYKLFVIEDAAQSLGTDYIFPCGTRKKAGTLSTIGCTSFFPSKNLGAWGDGGAVFTENELLAEKLKALMNHGMKNKYYYEYVGMNSRLDTLQAAILNVKLKNLDTYNRARQKAAEHYDNLLKDCPGIKIPSRVKWSDHTFHQYTIQTTVDSRDKLKSYLEKSHIPAMIYYPVPIHLQYAYGELGYKNGDFPVAEELSRKVLSLPMHTELDEEQLNYIAGKIVEFYS